MNTFPFVRSARLAMAAIALALTAANVRAQVVIGNGCADIPLPLSYAGVPLQGTTLSIGNALPTGQQWIGIVAIGSARPGPLQIYDPSLFACYSMPSGQPAPVQIWVDPVATYFFYDAGGVVNVPIPAGAGLAGLTLTAQQALGHALLRVTQALSFTIQ